MSSESINLIAIVVTAIGILGTLLWRTGTISWRLGGLEHKVNGLTDWMHDIKTGASPVCAAHDQKLADHSRRIGRLENGGHVEHGHRK